LTRAAAPADEIIAGDAGSCEIAPPQVGTPNLASSSSSPASLSAFLHYLALSAPLFLVVMVG
jgi:hypothetical protein